MNVLDFLIHINAYDETNVDKNNFKWSHRVKGVTASTPSSGEISLAAAASKTLFTGETNIMIYIESDQDLDIVINGSATANTLIPPTAGSERKSGVFFNTGDIQSVTITNTSANTANVFYATTGS